MKNNVALYRDIVMYSNTGVLKIKRLFAANSKNQLKLKTTQDSILTSPPMLCRSVFAYLAIPLFAIVAMLYVER